MLFVLMGLLNEGKSFEFLEMFWVCLRPCFLGMLILAFVWMILFTQLSSRYFHSPAGFSRFFLSSYGIRIFEELARKLTTACLHKQKVVLAVCHTNIDWHRAPPTFTPLCEIFPFGI